MPSPSKGFLSMPHTLTGLSSGLGACGVILLSLWLVFEPAAQRWTQRQINTIVAENNFAKSEDVKRLEKALEKTNRSVDAVKSNTGNNSTKIDSVSRQLDRIEGLQEQFLRQFMERGVQR